ncbi:MAG: substrate-binding domain-containing protein [Oscillospiraceae bacterium]|nr:substrate-binding domain-containing protein [Oscillospiraceae bacterium]
MKITKVKILAIALMLLFVLALSACNYIGADNTPMSPPEYPIIDGSTSTMIMHAAIRAYLTDEYLVDQHSQTYTALERLIPGSDDPADIVLAVKYYDDTLQDAKERGADLVVTPIAKEGFVFMLHKDNPIDSLTAQQLRDIFSGKVTNWKEFGGKDEKIVPVHRNWNSGSQTAMKDFMGDVPLTDMTEDDTIKLAFSMGIMIETVWTTGTGAIGYNIYSWSAGQGAGFGLENVKFLTVDGIAPSSATLADNSYPLIVYTYSYYNNGNAKGKALTDWLLSAEGQNVIASAGYVGIYGDISTENMPDFNKDDFYSVVATEEYYIGTGLYDPIGVMPTPDGDKYRYQYSNSERLPGRQQIANLAADKGKAVTILRLVHFWDTDENNHEYKRFIVLTRERGGAFEVINEGEVLSFENGIITSWR